MIKKRSFNIFIYIIFINAKNLDLNNMQNNKSGLRDESILVEEPTLCQQFRAFVLLVAISSAVSTAAMATGMATLKAAGYPGFTAMNEALISAVIGPMVNVPAALLLKKFCGIDLKPSEEGSVGAALEGIAGVVLDALTGYGILNAAGKIQELSLGSAAAASAVGASEFFAGIAAFLYCCACGIFTVGRKDPERPHTATISFLGRTFSASFRGRTKEASLNEALVTEEDHVDVEGGNGLTSRVLI